MKTYTGIYDLNLYPKEAMLKAAYMFIDDYYIHIRTEGDTYRIEFTGKESDHDEIIAEFENELLAAVVRLQVYKQTHVLREVMLGRAMASTMIMDESVEVTESSEEDKKALGDILQDWFKHE